MRRTRIFVAQSYALHQSLTIEGNAFQHCIKVLRLKAGAQLELFDGVGHSCEAEILMISKRHFTLIIKHVNEQQALPRFKLSLAQALIKHDKMDLVIQKAVELGVTKIIPLFTEFCDVKKHAKTFEKKFMHWQQIAISACEQCGQNYLPCITPPQNYVDWLQSSPTTRILFHPKASLTTQSLQLTQSEACIMIGPEGGFSEQEIKLAEEQGCKLVQFSTPFILRSETAAIAAVSLVQDKVG